MGACQQTLNNNAQDQGLTIEELEEKQYEIYMELIQQGYKLHDIDNMDIHYCIRVLFSQEGNKSYIEDIF